MNRKFLEGLGIEQEAIDKIMAENGTDIETIKTKYQDYAQVKVQLENATTTIANLERAKQDTESLQGEIERYKTQEKERLALETQTQKDKALTDNITAAFGDKAFTSDYVKNGLIADIKAQLADTANAGKGVKDIFDNLMVSLLKTNEILGSYRNLHWVNNLPIQLNLVESVAGIAFAGVLSFCFFSHFPKCNCLMCKKTIGYP